MTTPFSEKALDNGLIKSALLNDELLVISEEFIREYSFSDFNV